jgi:hypothetical protein
MKNKALLLFVSATLVWFAATTLAFGQSAGKARLRAYTTVIPRTGQGAVQAGHELDSGSALLPLWTYNVSSSRDHNNYSGVMVGRNPFGNEHNQSVDVPTQIVPIVITTNLVGTKVNFTTGNITTKPGVTTLDPTKPNSSCLTPPNDVPLTLYKQSPIIQEASFSMGGTRIGQLQYNDAFQRANFWAYTQGHQYSVALHPVSTTHTVYINVPAADGLALARTSLGPPDFCGRLGIIDIGWFDSYLDSTIIPALYPQGVNPGSLPIFLLANVVLASPVTDIFTCCVLGYHSYEGFPIQTYAVMDFDTTGVFGPGVFDTSVSAHEVGEWMNDPFGNNPVPRWGHIGQQPGCQGNLEVGDPLTGTNVPPVTMPNGYSYHLQELVFFSWFYGAPSIAVNGWYSDNNTFTTDAGPPCM